MFAVKNCLLSDEIKTVKFCCDIDKCKGLCCVEGDIGAPLEENEISLIEDNVEKIFPFMTKEGIDIVNVKGVFETSQMREYFTPLINKKDCAFICYEKGIALCAIEKAFHTGVINFNKPISCHLYPIRIKQYHDTIAINYDHWDICDCGNKKNIPLYEFLKIPLIRRFGEDWYEELLLAVNKK